MGPCLLPPAPNIAKSTSQMTSRQHVKGLPSLELLPVRTAVIGRPSSNPPDPSVTMHEIHSALLTSLRTPAPHLHSTPGRPPPRTFLRPDAKRASARYIAGTSPLALPYPDNDKTASERGGCMCDVIFISPGRRRGRPVSLVASRSPRTHGPRLRRETTYNLPSRMVVFAPPQPHPRDIGSAGTHRHWDLDVFLVRLHDGTVDAQSHPSAPTLGRGWMRV